MRKLLIGIILTWTLGWAVAPPAAGRDVYNVKSERRMLKARQKQQWKTLKSQQKAQQRSWKNLHVSKASRKQMKHQMAHDRRLQRESQKNDWQNLKDRQRIAKERMRANR